MRARDLNFEKLSEVLRRYRDYHLDGYLCVIDELCPSISTQLSKEIERFDVPDNFLFIADYVA